MASSIDIASPDQKALMNAALRSILAATPDQVAAVMARGRFTITVDGPLAVCEVCGERHESMKWAYSHTAPPAVHPKCMRFAPKRGGKVIGHRY